MENDNIVEYKPNSIDYKKVFEVGGEAPKADCFFGEFKVKNSLIVSSKPVNCPHTFCWNNMQKKTAQFVKVM